MGYGDRGRYHNVGLGSRELLPATRKQLAKLFRMTRRDHSTLGLNRGQASERIEKAIEAKEDRQSQKSVGGFHKLFEVVYRQASQAASDAGRDWLSRHPEKKFDVLGDGGLVPCHGVVGSAYLRKPGRSTSFMQWFAEVHPESKSEILEITHEYSDRWERDLHVVAQAAALRILIRQGIQGVKLFVREEPGEKSRIEA